MRSDVLGNRLASPGLYAGLQTLGGHGHETGDGTAAAQPGNVTVTADAAKVFAAEKIDLIGNESQTVGTEDTPMEVHKILLSTDVVLLEGIRLSAVSEGVYLLNAAPLNLSGADGSPCRAVLIEVE